MLDNLCQVECNVCDVNDTLTLIWIMKSIKQVKTNNCCVIHACFVRLSKVSLKLFFHIRDLQRYKLLIGFHLQFQPKILLQNYWVLGQRMKNMVDVNPNVRVNPQTESKRVHRIGDLQTIWITVREAKEGSNCQTQHKRDFQEITFQ